MAREGKIPVCAECASPEVKADAWVTWNAETHQWEVDYVADEKGAHCPDCGGEARIKWVRAKQAKEI